jgi:hypothetical protein
MSELDDQLHRLSEHRAEMVPPYSPPVGRTHQRGDRRAAVGAIAAALVVAIAIGALWFWSEDDSRSVYVETQTTSLERERLVLGPPRPLPVDAQFSLVAVNGELWFAANGGGLVGYDTVTGVTRHVDPSPLAEHYAPSSPFFAPGQVVAQGTTLWVADGGGVQVDGYPDGPSYERWGGVVRVNAISGRIETVVSMPDGSPTQIALSGSTLWAVNGRVLMGIETLTNTIIRALPFGEGNSYKGFVVDGTSAWLGDYATGAIIKLDLVTGDILSEFSLPGDTRSGIRADALNFPIASTGGGLVVVSGGRMLGQPYALRLVDKATGAVRATLLLDGDFWDAVATGRSLVVITGAGIALLDLDSFEWRDRIALPGPRVMRFLALDGDHLWLTNRPYATFDHPEANTASTFQRVGFG